MKIKYFLFNIINKYTVCTLIGCSNIMRILLCYMCLLARIVSICIKIFACIHSNANYYRRIHTTFFIKQVRIVHACFVGS